MAQILYLVAGALRRVYLPAVAAPAADLAAAMLTAGRLPFGAGVPHLALEDSHPAAGVPLSRLTVNFQAGTVQIGSPPPPDMPSIKADRIEADREECRRRLVEHYGDALEQGSRFAGGYGVIAAANILAGTVAAIAASNAARDEINAATTVEQVEAVTVVWPVLA